MIQHSAHIDNDNDKSSPRCEKCFCSTLTVVFVVVVDSWRMWRCSARERDHPTSSTSPPSSVSSSNVVFLLVMNRHLHVNVIIIASVLRVSDLSLPIYRDTCSS